MYSIRLFLRLPQCFPHTRLCVSLFVRAHWDDDKLYKGLDDMYLPRVTDSLAGAVSFAANCERLCAVTRQLLDDLHVSKSSLVVSSHAALALFVLYPAPCTALGCAHNTRTSARFDLLFRAYCRYIVVCLAHKCVDSPVCVLVAAHGGEAGGGRAAAVSLHAPPLPRV